MSKITPKNAPSGPLEPQPRILKVARMGNPVLLIPSQDVQDPTDPEVHQIVQDMIATVEEIGSYAGLAAPQVHLSLKIVLIATAVVSPKPDSTAQDSPVTVMINPSWEPMSQEMDLDWEGCFSLPQLLGEVPRYVHIRYRYQTLEGKTIEGKAAGYHARVIQHECDHLEGKLYLHRMKDLKRLGYDQEIRRYSLKQEEPSEEEASE